MSIKTPSQTHPKSSQKRQTGAKQHRATSYKGNRDRLVPLPQATLTVLRRFWQTHRHPELLFPNRHAGLKGAHLATSPLDRAAHAAQRETPAGVSLPLLRSTDASHPATDSGQCGQATKFGADGGDGCVSHGHGKDDAPTGATAALGLKLPKNQVSTAEFAESARAER